MSSRPSYVVQRQLKAAPWLRQKGRYIPDTPKRKEIAMFLTKQHRVMARTLGLAVVASVALAGCATYSDEFAGINSRLDQLDSRVQSAAQSAESANQSAQQANQRLDRIEGRVQQLEAAPTRVPRGYSFKGVDPFVPAHARRSGSGTARW